MTRENRRPSASRRSRRSSGRGAVGSLFVALVASVHGAACGDVPADLITGPGAPKLRCNTDDDCAPPQPRCDTASNRCVQCLGTGFVADCPAGKICAQPAASCVTACTSASECSSRVCHVTAGLCGRCSSDADCPTSDRRCDTTSGNCLACGSNEDCGGERPFCSAGRCVECISNGDCDWGEECSSELGECARPCDADDDCLADDPKCHPAIRFCVECYEDRDCGGSSCRNWECSSPRAR